MGLCVVLSCTHTFWKEDSFSLAKRMAKVSCLNCWLFAVILTEKQVLQLKPDDEVASIQWAAIPDLYETGTRQYCNPDISALAAMLGRRLNELGYT